MERRAPQIRTAVAIAIAVLMLLLVSAGPAAAQNGSGNGSAEPGNAAKGSAGKGQQPWQVAEELRSGLFDARTALLLDDDADLKGIDRADAALSDRLRGELERDAPGRLAEYETALEDARRAVSSNDELGLAAAQGSAIAALRAGAREVVLLEAAAGNVERARAWLLVRDFRQATRFTRPGVDATRALDALRAGEISPDDAITSIEKDLLDAYQAQLLQMLGDAEFEQERGYASAAAESAAMAAGYWSILADEFEAQRSPATRAEADRDFERMLSLAIAGAPGLGSAITDAEANLERFVAAPLTPEEEVRTAQQMIRFLDLVPIEYRDGTDDGRVTIPFELQEADAFIEAAQTALVDLSAVLDERDPDQLTALEAELDTLNELVTDAREGVVVAPLSEVEDAHDRATDLIDPLFPEEWKQSSDDADYDLIEIGLDQMEAAISAGERDQAEQARLTAYAFFEFGPEIKLSAFDPGLVTEVEGLIWFGARGKSGLAELIAGDGSARDIRDTRLELDEALKEARAKTGEGASDLTVVTNAALIVFREGLEAILIIAAITASMIGGNRRLRQPVYRGALLALPASAALWLLAQFVLDSLSQYGEKLEAIVGLIAIAVLVLVLNWFFHKVYWTEWISGHRKRGKALIAGGAAAGFTSATIAGLYLLGFSSVFREGFETVLFLQALQLSSGTGIVLAGVGLGLAATAAVGALTFALEQRLPYKRMLVVTGVLIALVLFVLVGNTMRTLQGVGWLGITPIDIGIPLWMGTWLGIFPTVETLAAQALAIAFVLGSYFAAEWVSKRKLNKAIAAAEARELERSRGEGDDPNTAEEPNELTGSPT